MKHTLILILMVLLVVPSSAQEEVPVSTVQPTVIMGYLSYDSALVSMPEYKSVMNQLATLRQAYEAELQRVEEDFNSKYEDFLDGQKDFPRTILLKRQTELQDMLQRNLEFKQQGLADLEKTERDLLAPLRIRLNETIATLARSKHLAVVLNTDSKACPFIEPMLSVNLNEEVILRLKK